MSDEFWDEQKLHCADKLGEYLLMTDGTVYGLTDAELRHEAEKQIERVRKSGRRWSWTVLAAEAIRKAYEGPQ